LKYLFYICLFCTCNAFAQKIELGIGVGGLHYKGDISPNFHPSFVKPGANLFFRYNYSRAVSFKAQGMIGAFGADESKVNDPLNIARGMSFSTGIAEGSIQAEYNFLSYKINKRQRNFTPYLFLGLGVASANVNNTQTGVKALLPLVIPFGVALKGQIKNNWGWGVEFGTRKTYSDYLDNLGANTYSNNTNRLQQADYAHNDMYYFTTFSLSYTFFKIECPQ
jgi:hypothetical protein